MMMVPLIVWMIAYFLDFVFTLMRKDAWELVKRGAVVRGSGAMMMFLFLMVFILAQNSYILKHLNMCDAKDSWLSLSSRMTLRTISLCGMFLVIMLLKWSSLTSLQIKEDVKRY